MIPVVGASGAIAGLLGAFVVGIRRRAPACSTRARASHRAFPRARVRADSGVAMLQIAWALLAVDDGVGYWAHVGGFAVGVTGAIVMKKLGWVIEDAGDGSRVR